MQSGEQQAVAVDTLWIRLSNQVYALFQCHERRYRPNFWLVFGRRNLTDEEGLAIHNHLAVISSDWSCGRAPDFSHPWRRFGYIYCYPAAHAHLIELSLLANQDARRLVATKVHDGTTFRACFFGGGPGTEVLGLAKFLSGRLDENEALNVDALVLDREGALEQDVSTVAACVRETLERERTAVNIDVHFAQFDFCGEAGDVLFDILGRDLYVFNHAISEVPDHSGALEPLLASIVEAMPVGAILLIADREQDKIVPDREGCNGSDGPRTVDADWDPPNG